ncbi:hypothetical protein GCM10010121_063940 [Streptomyces brasiliensis]|uniref:Uncharacterized protein n=1 Tax=Streptomyces brasiliensis TaxID=1954 RepID=A0A917L482_9ACTN|nr:hypothetical protein GCM10010121_063940 [Streptomyces brasiliensis]
MVSRPVSELDVTEQNGHVRTVSIAWPNHNRFVGALAGGCPTDGTASQPHPLLLVFNRVVVR